MRITKMSRYVWNLSSVLSEYVPTEDCRVRRGLYETVSSIWFIVLGFIFLYDFFAEYSLGGTCRTLPQSTAAELNSNIIYQIDI